MTPTGVASAPLHSQLLADDPDMRDLVEEFVQGLSERAAELINAHAAREWDRLKTLAHQLKGAGGSYGYPAITTLGATMETAFKQQQDAHFADWMDQLSGLIAAARAGLGIR